MSKFNKKPKIKIFLGIILLALLVAWFLFWLKFSDASRVKTAIIASLPVPAIFVESRPIYSTEILNRLQEGRLIYSGNKITVSEADLKQEVLNRIIYEKKLQILSLRQKASLENWQNFVSLPPDDLKKSKILKHAAEAQAEEDSIKFWFFSQKALNQKTYASADSIMEKIGRGEDFGNLAKIYSQDKESAELYGDLGPLMPENLLFEIKEPLLQAKTGETLVLPSRLGVHLIQTYLKKISGQGGDVLYLRQIYLAGEDFKEWVQEETKDYKIVTLIKI